MKIHLAGLDFHAWLASQWNLAAQVDFQARAPPAGRAVDVGYCVACELLEICPGLGDCSLASTRFNALRVLLVTFQFRVSNNRGQDRLCG